METVQPAPIAKPAPTALPTLSDTPFVNEMRLNVQHWALVFGIVLFIVSLTPWVWKKIERFAISPDYRIPYNLSKDYWLYQRRLQGIAPTNIVLIGDSVVWGEYVLHDGTLSHFLNQQAGNPDRFINAGVNGLFPLALEGLIRSYGGPIRHQKVILHCNVLWLTSPKADLQTQKEEKFNHAHLVPQFSPRIPCYGADIDERLAVIVERKFPFAQWANHLQNAYFEQKNILSWTLEEGPGDPPAYPNSYKNPFAQLTLVVPSEPTKDPERGPNSPRHKPWSNTGKGATHFEWVELERSLQWGAFGRLISVLKARDNDVLVLLGPFNEHLMAEENRTAYRKRRDGIAAWLKTNQVAQIAPETLPSALYADASHPLTQGYELLAQQLFQNETFRAWIDGK